MQIIYYRIKLENTCSFFDFTKSFLNGEIGIVLFDDASPRGKTVIKSQKMQHRPMYWKRSS